MTFREFLKLSEQGTVGLNPLGGPTASGALGMNPVGAKAVRPALPASEFSPGTEPLPNPEGSPLSPGTKAKPAPDASPLSPGTKGLSKVPPSPLSPRGANSGKKSTKVKKVPSPITGK